MFDSDVNQVPNNPILGEVYTKESGFINSYSAPTFIDLGDRILLATGTEKGTVYLYDSIELNSNNKYQLITSHLGELREGAVSVPAFADIDNDNLMEMAIGTRRGGIAIYETNLQIDISSPTREVIVNSEKVKIAPNPSPAIFNIGLSEIDCSPCSAEIWSIEGKILQEYSVSNENFVIDLSAFPSGFYMMYLVEGDKIHVSQLVKIAL